MKLGKAKANYVDANTLTRRAFLYKPEYTNDGEGGSTVEYIFDSNVFADLRPNNQSRSVDEGRLEFDRSSIIYIRYRTDILDTWQLSIEEIWYTIHSIKDVENQHRFLELIVYS